MLSNIIQPVRAQLDRWGITTTAAAAETDDQPSRSEFDGSRTRRRLPFAHTASREPHREHGDLENRAGGLFTSCEEEQSGGRFEHALVFFYGCSVPAAFLAEHALCLEVCDGVFDRGPDFA